MSILLSQKKDNIPPSNETITKSFIYPSCLKKERILPYPNSIVRYYLSTIYVIIEEWKRCFFKLFSTNCE